MKYFGLQLVILIVMFAASQLSGEEPASRAKALVLISEAERLFAEGDERSELVAKLYAALELDPGNVRALHLLSLDQQENRFGFDLAPRRAQFWLARNDEYSGGWRFDDPDGFPDFGSNTSRIGATALTILAMASVGITHETGMDRHEIERGMDYIWANAAMAGDALDASGDEFSLQSHILATLAFSELQSKSYREKLKPTVAALVKHLLSRQQKDGGWASHKDSPTDLATTVWALVALSSARLSGLKVDRKVADDGMRFIDAFKDKDGLHFGFEKGQRHPTATAMAWYARFLLVKDSNDERFRESLKKVIASSFDDRDAVQIFFRTQLAHVHGGKVWDEWRATVLVRIEERQIGSGREAGSWFDKRDPSATSGGRLEQTCMNVLTLATYYRHLTILRPYHEGLWSEEQKAKR